MNKILLAVLLAFAFTSFQNEGFSRPERLTSYSQKAKYNKRKRRAWIRKKASPSPISFKLAYGAVNGIAFSKDTTMINGDIVFNMSRSVKIPLGFTSWDSSFRNMDGENNDHIKVGAQTIDTGIGYYWQLGRHVAIPIGMRTGWAQIKLTNDNFADDKAVLVGYNLTPFTGMSLQFTKGFGIEFQARLPLYAVEIRGQEDESSEEEEESSSPSRTPTQYLGTMVFQL